MKRAWLMLLSLVPVAALATMVLVGGNGRVATPSPPSGDTALETAIAALSAGEWGTVTISNSFNPDPNGTGDTMFSYTGRGMWDGTRKLIHIYGGEHGAGGTSERQHLATYDAETNAWLTIVAVPEGYNLYEHSYYNQTVDPATGYVYMRPGFGTTDVKRYDFEGATFLSDWADPGYGSNYGIILENHPDLGAILWGHYWGIGQRASGAGSWTTVTTANRMGDGAPVSAYSPRNNSVYVGGGTGSGAGQFWQIDSAGSMTSRAYPSGVTLTVWDAGSGSSTAILLGGSESSGIKLITKGGSIREYNEGTNTWSSEIDTLPAGVPPGVNDGGDWVAINLDTLNAIAVVKLSSMTAVSTTMHIRKND